MCALAPCRLFLFVLFPLSAALACSLPGAGASSAPTPLFRTATPRTESTVTVPGSRPPSETPLGVFPPTSTRDPSASLTPIIAPSRTPSPTPTGTPPSPPQGELLVIHFVEAVGIRRDSSRPNGAIVTVRIAFSGGVGPFIYYDEGVLQPGNPFEADSSCGGTLIHTARVESADGQSVSMSYFVSVDCPP